MNLNNTCTASVVASGVSTISWLNDISSVVGLISALISAVFGLMSIGIIIYSRLKKKSELNELTSDDIVKAIGESKDGVDDFIKKITEAIDNYNQNKNKKE